VHAGHDRLLDEIVKVDPDSLKDWRAAKVCQVCGALALVGDFHE
jgi:hypothetical protein